MLEFADPPDLDGLELALSVRLRWYRKWRSQQRRRSGRNKLSGVPRLFEKAPLALLPAVSIRGDSFAEILRATSMPALWHLQIRRRTGPRKSDSWVPRYYARARLRNGEWRILWIGERWLADAVHQAITKLDRDEPALPDSSVRVVSSRAYQFTTLWIESNDTHLVAHASRPLTAALPRLEYLPGNEVQQRLLDHFDDRLAQEGIGGDQTGPPVFSF